MFIRLALGLVFFVAVVVSINLPYVNVPIPQGSATLIEERMYYPNNGDNMDLVVNPGEFIVLTGGPIYIGKEGFPGGTDRGNVLILSPGTYNFPYLLKFHNWYGRYQGDQPTIWQVFWTHKYTDVRWRIKNMFENPNCINGCKIVNIAMMDQEGTYFSWYENHFAAIPIPFLRLY